MPAMRALAASWAAEVFTGAEPGAAVPPVDGGGAVRLIQPAPASIAAPATTHAAATRAAELEGRRIGEGDVGMRAD